jgi:hypothetical protein
MGMLGSDSKYHVQYSEPFIPRSGRTVEESSILSTEERAIDHREEGMHGTEIVVKEFIGQVPGWHSVDIHRFTA